MKILVTGGAGFIGSNFIRYILDKYPDYELINLDKLTYSGNIENLKDIEKNSRYKFIKGDICDMDLVANIVKDCDCIVNFAAESHVDRSITDPSAFIKTNYFGTYTLLESAKRYKTKFLQISTDEIYGSLDNGSFIEESPLKPSSPYSASKAASDMLCFSYWTTYSVPVTITRSSNNFGPYQYPEKLVSLFITNALEGQPLPLYGDGLYVRDWLYVIDNCSAIDLILHKGEPGQIYNIGGGNELTNLELTSIILRFLKKGTELIKRVKDRPGHDRRYSLNITKIRRLGWHPQHNFEDALKKTIQWYQENVAWWRPLKERLCKDNYHWL